MKTADTSPGTLFFSCIYDRNTKIILTCPVYLFIYEIDLLIFLV